MARDAAIAQLAALAQAAQGIPQSGAIPAPSAAAPGVDPEGGLESLLMQLRTGQISAGQLLQLVAALVGQGGPQQPQMQQEPSPEEMAMMQAQGGGGGVGGGEMGGMGGGSSIEQAYMGQ
jgi:hypothetical protein